MKAVVFDRTGGPEVLEYRDVPDPACGIGGCNAGFDDCDANMGNGCESDLASVMSCGMCGVMCPVVVQPCTAIADGNPPGLGGGTVARSWSNPTSTRMTPQSDAVR